MAEDHPVFKLGKQEHKHDDRTLLMADFIELPVFPAKFDFDKHRAPFPKSAWGNHDFGDCVIAAEANALLRMERVEQRRTIAIRDVDAINRYKSLSGCESPGDVKDNGLVMLTTMGDWRYNGFARPAFSYKDKKTDKVIHVPARIYKIAAYGELEPADNQMLRAAIYLLGGVHFGFALPISAQDQTRLGYWDVEPGSEAAPGSWGGHCVYASKYDTENIYVQTWGKEIKVSNGFVRRYCDEAWAVVDDFDRWSKTSHLDVQALLGKLHDIGAKHIG